MAKIDWNKAIKPLIKEYKGKQHPLDYKNIYQLLVMVVLSAQSSDNQINSIAPELFKRFPDMKSLAKADSAELIPYINKVIGHRKKADWILRIAKQIKEDKNIPLTMDDLVELPGIGRKSANVIMREAKVKAEGVMVDLHVVRVANRLGIADSPDPKVIEQQIMKEIAPSDWGETGMSMSFLGREICRPTDPKHEECVMRGVCQFYKTGGDGMMEKKKKGVKGSRWGKNPKK
jgi:endonuclease-3